MSPMQRTSRFLQRFQPKIFNEINVSFISQVIFDLILNIGDKHNGIQFIDSDPLHGRLVRIRGFGQLRLGSFLDVAFKNDVQSMLALDRRDCIGADGGGLAAQSQRAPAAP